MAFSMAGGGPSNPQINVTPLIDVLLVLIIVFMVVVTQQKEKGLTAQIPEQQAHDNRNHELESTIVIQVLDGGGDQVPKLKINQEAVTWDNLAARLHDVFKTRATRVAFVRADNEVAFQYVADVIATARNADVQRVGLLDVDYAKAEIPGR